MGRILHLQLVLALFWIFPYTAMGQPGREDSSAYFPSYYWNTLELVERPLQWKGEQWVAVGAGASFVGSMLIFDEPINATIMNWNGPFARGLGKTGDVVGGPYLQFGLSGSAILFGYLTENKPLTNFGTDNLQAQVFSAGATLLLKHLTHRERPDQFRGAAKWHGPLVGWEHRSFSSGHTALAFSTATMAYLHSGKKWWVAVAGYGAASAIGISRMQQQQHWSSDVVMGALVGTVMSNFVFKMQERRRYHGAEILKPVP